MYRLSWLGDDGRVWFVAAAFEAVRRGRPLPRFLHSVAWLGVESAVVNLVVKKVVRRPRPLDQREHARDLRIPTDTSFPSGHAASAATMAVLLSHDSPMAPVYLALAAGIGASRVHVGVHHGSDVVVGWAVGTVFGAIGRRSGRHLMAPSRGWRRERPGPE
jgi:undecaprenyl-diphosphatase